MNEKPPEPIARLTMVTLGVGNMRASIAFYEALGFARKFKATGEIVAFFDTGGTALGLFPWDELAGDVTLPDHPRPRAFRGMTLAWNCRTRQEVDFGIGFCRLKGRVAPETGATDRLWRLFRLFRRSG